MPILACLICVLWVASIPSSAQSLDVIPDMSQLRGGKGLTQWEFHYAYADTSIRYVRSASGDYVGEVHFNVQLVSNAGDTARAEWIAANASPTPITRHERYLTGIQTLYLKPAQYLVSVSAVDLADTSNVVKSTFPIVVREFDSKIDMSDVVFTQKSVPSGIDPRFMRNDVQVMPNARHDFVGKDPSLSVYLEVYNTKANAVDSFTVEYRILNSVKQEEFTVLRPQPSSAEGIVERVDIPIDLLNTGVYYLMTSVKSTDLTTTHASALDRFFVLNPELPPVAPAPLTEDEQFVASEWYATDGTRLALELEMSDILANNAERATRKGLSETRAQQRYLFSYWRSRDPDPSTFENERLITFREMFERAQKFYGNPTFRDGWRTDRGIILMKYGIPSEIEQSVQSIDTRPYEIWTYRNLQGGVAFYFVDYQLMQNHKLVHSTMRGEIRNEKWREMFAKPLGSDPNSNSR